MLKDLTPFRPLGHILVAAIVFLVGSNDAHSQSDRVTFERQVIDANPPKQPWYKMVGDLNGDGQLDIVVGGSHGPLVWYVAPDWKREKLADGGWDGVNGAVGDVDGDGDADIVMGGTIWFSNPRVGGGSWTLHRIDDQKAHDIELGDLDGDGRLDVVSRDQSAFQGSGEVIFVYHQTDSAGWTKHAIQCPPGEGLKLADVDADNDPDIVIAGIWFENRPEAGQQQWLEHEYTSEWTEPDAKVETADFNNDGRLDIVLTPAELAGEASKLAWYAAPADRRATAWKEHVIVPEIESIVHGLGVGDFDSDGLADVVIAEMHQGQDPDEVVVYFNDHRGESWQRQLLSTDGSHDIVVADIGADGDLDVVGANHGGAYHPLELWENQSK